MDLDVLRVRMYACMYVCIHMYRMSLGRMHDEAEILAIAAHKNPVDQQGGVTKSRPFPG